MKKQIILLLTPLLLFFPALARGADSPGIIQENMIEIILGLVLVICIVVLLVLLVVLQAMKVMAQLHQPKSDVDKAPQPSAWQKFIQSMTDTVPIAEEDTILTDHAYDGIQELDNRLPPWWLYGFYFTIVFGFAYVGYYHIYKTGDLQAAEYQEEMIAAEEKIQLYLASLDNNIDESNVELLQDVSEIALGKVAYDESCVACHGDEGQGGIGPNFTDKYWIHGGDVKQVFKTIKYGVPEKGMISWKNKFTPKQMQQLASYIISLEGTNPLNPKEPQGELYERKESETTEVEAKANL